MNTLIVGDIRTGKTHLAGALEDACGAAIPTLVIEAATLLPEEVEHRIKAAICGKKICDVVVVAYPDQKFDMKMFDRIITIKVIGGDVDGKRNKG